MEILNLVPQKIKKTATELVTRLKGGEVLILPTDTVYGLVCDASNNKAVERIFKIKKRDRAQALPVFVEDIKMAEHYAFLTINNKEFLKKHWPGATTIILEAKNQLLSPLLYLNDTIALRRPDYKLLAEVLKNFTGPLAQTSANISGQPAITKAKDILKQFEAQDEQPDLFVNFGDLPDRKPSEIIDYTEKTPKSVRK